LTLRFDLECAHHYCAALHVNYIYTVYIPNWWWICPRCLPVDVIWESSSC